MPFKMLDPPDAALAPVPMLPASDEARAYVAENGLRRVKRGEFQALRRNDGTWLVEIAPGKLPADAAPAEVQAHIGNLCTQIDALSRQLDEHSAEATGMVALLRQMIEARQRELELWLARDEGWERRIEMIEGAIAERDEFRRREAVLAQERDEARRAAAAAQARVADAERMAEAAWREAAAAQSLAEKANAEQLRLRAEREVDRTVWVRERRQLAAKVEQLTERGWLARFRRGKS